ncbi:MAG TPA: helix-turn-helix domain-containing protein [Bacteroidales bacterium]|nr:helix-turn-helix domain-containing protein [Bacteroidales bacterium]
MSKIKRKFDLDEKLRILREGETNGVEVTCRSYQIARSLFYNWKNKFNRQGPDGLAPRYHRADPVTKALEKENERLRKIISKQALELEVKEELLKKTKLHYK